MRDEATARYFTEILGLEPAVRLGEFAVLRVSPDTTLDFVDSDGDFDRLPYAFLVTQAEFDQIFDRLKQREVPYWSDPLHDDPNHINTWDDGLEILTRPYGSGGTTQRPHPLVAPTIEEPAPNDTD